MRAELLAVGDELLYGDIVNGNAAWLGQQLADAGVRLSRSVVVGDEIDVIAVVTGFDYVRQAFRLRRGTPSTDGSAVRSGGSAGAAGQARQGAEPLATDGSDAR